MFPVRESSKYLALATAVLLIAIQIVFLVNSFWVTLETKAESSKGNEIQVYNLKDNWELQNYQNNSIPTKRLTQEVSENLNKEGDAQKSVGLNEKEDISGYIYSDIVLSEKVNKLAQKYQAEPVYLDYIIKVEKEFQLEPCELLAVIAQESGFKPQTHMDGGSLSYSTTQMKMPTAKTAYMAITEYYKIDIPAPTHDRLNENKYYAAFLAGGYLRYLHDVYQNKYESYTAYNWGIGGRMTFYQKNGHFKSPYALKVAGLEQSFQDYMGEEYNSIRMDDKQNCSSAF